MGLFSWPGLRAVVYLKRMSDALERIAAFTDAQMITAPRRSRRNASPEAEVFKSSVKDWNEGWRERNPDEYDRMREEI